MFADSVNILLKKRTHIFALCSLLFLVNPANSTMRVTSSTPTGAGARSYAAAYQQVADMRQRSLDPQTSEELGLPVQVPNEQLANSIANGTATNTNITDLDACASIYANGTFAWDIPTGGLKSNSTKTESCVAVVEMRAIQGSEDVLLATAKVAAGDSINCNISTFPSASYTVDAGAVTFPADKEPTIEDVQAAMDAEQRKNAGLKIAAGAIVGALGGNIAGSNDVGKSNLIGLDKGKLTGTAIGAASGALIMTGATHSGYVTGNVIQSAGLNAAAGGMIGNMVASGDSVLYIEKCNDSKTGKCLWGIVEKKKMLSGNEKGYYNIENGYTAVCTDTDKGCERVRIIGSALELGKNNGSTVGDVARNREKIKASSDVKKFCLKDDTMSKDCSNDQFWIPVGTNWGRPGDRIAALVKDFDDSFFGKKLDDYYKWKDKNQSAIVYRRDAQGQANDAIPADEGTLENFYPLTQDASDGGIIDIDNKARMKSTLIGAGAGAGLGAFSAYQGAQDEIDQRWISAVQAYKDSLQKIYCATGKRFLASYNDIAIIPQVK